MTMTLNDLDYVRQTVRQVPDFPKPGILFLDITTATKDAKSMNLMIDFLFIFSFPKEQRFLRAL